MQKYADDVFTLDSSNNPVPNSEASVTVYIAGTSSVASIFSDDGVTPKANPFVVEADGSLEFYAANGRYDIVVEKSPYRPHHENDILLDDASTVTSGSFSTAISADTSLFTRLSITDSTDVSVSNSADSSVVVRLSTVDSTNLSSSVSADTSLATRLSTVDSSNLSTNTSADTSLTTRDSTITSGVTSVTTRDSELTSADTSIVSRFSTVDSSLTSVDTSAVTRLTSADTSIVTQLSSVDSSDASVTVSADTSLFTRLSTIDSSDLSVSLSAANSAATGGGVSQSVVDSADVSVVDRLSVIDSTNESSDVSADASVVTRLSTVDSTNLSTSVSADSSVLSAAGSPTNAQYGYRNLAIARASNTTATVTADLVVMENSSGNTKRFTSLSETVDITASGANGLDTGSEASNTWYHIWAIGKADGTQDCLLSASATAPTLPSGYTYKCYLGAVRNNSSGNFEYLKQVDNIVSIPLVVVLNAGSQTSWTAVDISTYVPSTAKKFIVQLQPNCSGDTGYFYFSPVSDGSVCNGYAYMRILNATYVSSIIPTEIPLVVSQTVYYKTEGYGTATMYAVGFEY